MNLPKIVQTAQKFTTDNSPLLLSAAAIVGTVATAYLTGKATFKAAEMIGDEAEKRMLQEIEENRKFPTKDKIKLVWPQYLPAAGTAITTIGCIVFAHKISATRLTALAAAYTVSERRFEEYKNKITEKMGIQKERAARDELAQDRVNSNPPSNQTIIMGGGDALFQDAMSGRYFMSDMETVKGAMNKINYKMMHEMEMPLTAFYDELGLEATKISDDIGWNVDHPMDLSFHTAMADNNRPCIVVDYIVSPGPLRGHSFR
jgi:hypothetical protein